MESNPDGPAGGDVGTLPCPSKLTSEDFATFFRDVHGYDPFPWQQRLTAQVLEQRTWPEVIDLPTGTGKTAVLDTAVFMMAACPTDSPRRIVFVIDRRIVVDQVCRRALRIRDRLTSATTPILERVRDRLCHLSGGEPLGVAALRGGIPEGGSWTHRPEQPWVVVSTVDQFGSRLLFRGYGVTPSMRPIHAGLAGNDCLVILDEVHLSVPFAKTLTQVSALRCSELLPRRFATVEMSATRGGTEGSRFTLLDQDLEGCRELRRRVTSPKQAQLVSVRDQEAVPAAVLKIIGSIDRANQRDGIQVRSIGVVVNRVRTARETHKLLAREGCEAYLITGRMRPLDKVAALDRISPIVDPDGGGRGDKLAIVVATQAIEVGADFSFDAIITECAAADSLRQRFGRLDRRGTYSELAGCPAQAWILGPKSVVGAKKPDPIYGDSVRTTWEELERRLKEDGLLDVSPTALRDFPVDANAPRANAPLMLRTHMDAWVQTCPEPLVQPTLDWFLHGIDQNGPADVSILWRWDRSAEALRLVPPRQAEFMQIPIAAAKAWLAASEEVDIADVGQLSEAVDARAPEGSCTKRWVRWAGFSSGVEHLAVKDIRPGDVLVIDPKEGGMSAETWDPSSSDAVEDLGDAAQCAYGLRATLRLDSRLSYVNSPPRPSDDTDEGVTATERIATWLEEQTKEPNQQFDWIREIVEKLRKSFDLASVGLDDDSPDKGYYILAERYSQTKNPVVDAASMDGSDESGSFTATGVTLRRHLDGVGAKAHEIAKKLGFSPEIREDLRLAGQLHDLGKVDHRFQWQLMGGDPVELELRRDEPLAKSLRRARGEWKYPKGMRHEVASVAMIESNSDVLGPAHDRDLVLYLVGTHHGFGRPLPPIIEDPEPQVLSYTLDGHLMRSQSDLVESTLALDMADRFWSLVERYGYHGLAWLEAVLRLADHQQSAEEANQT